MVLILTLLLAVSIGSVHAQPGYWDANHLIDDGWNELSNGEYFESVGDPWSARQAYENASNAAGQSLIIADQMGVPFQERPASPYFLFGQAELHRAQLLYRLGAPWADVDYSLNRARYAFDDVLRLVDGRFPRGSPDWVGMRSEALFALGSVYFLLGNWTQPIRSCRRSRRCSPRSQQRARSKAPSTTPSASRPRGRLRAARCYRSGRKVESAANA
jgi:hypothetical protein